VTVDGPLDPGETHAESPAAPTPPERLDNGLIAATYVPLLDVDVPIASHLLSALGRARIPAYLASAPANENALRLYVSSEERADARTIVASVVRASGGDPASATAEPVTDPLADVDTDAAFAALVADWYVDTHTAIRDAERSLTEEDEDWQARLQRPAAEPTWLDDEHYVPPPPPPLPRFALPTILGLALLVISIVILGLGTEIGLPDELTWILGVGGVLSGAGVLVSRLRVHNDEDDDGSAV
jgi:hypothetical protein